jgi:mRNA interferase HigB
LGVRKNGSVLLRVVSPKLLRDHWEKPGCDGLEQPLRTWHAVTRKARWANLVEMKRDFPTVDLAHGRFVFDIKGTNCRLICSIDFVRHWVLALWVGSHSEYDALMKNDGRQFKRRYGELA